jgi:hypothetical protein
VPALATTTALVAGLSALEIVKIATENILRRRNADPRPSSESPSGSENTRILKKFRNSFVNLARPLLAFAQPVEAETFSVNNRVFNMWSVIEVRQRQCRVSCRQIALERRSCRVQQQEMLILKTALLFPVPQHSNSIYL